MRHLGSTLWDISPPLPCCSWGSEAGSEVTIRDLHKTLTLSQPFGRRTPSPKSTTLFHFTSQTSLVSSEGTSEHPGGVGGVIFSRNQNLQNNLLYDPPCCTICKTLLQNSVQYNLYHLLSIHPMKSQAEGGAEPKWREGLTSCCTDTVRNVLTPPIQQEPGMSQQQQGIWGCHGDGTGSFRVSMVTSR